MTTLETQASTQTRSTDQEHLLPEALLRLNEAVIIVDTTSSIIVEANQCAVSLFEQELDGCSVALLRHTLSGCSFTEPGVVVSHLTGVHGTRLVRLHIGDIDSNGRCAVIVLDLSQQSTAQGGVSDLCKRTVVEERERFARDLHDGVTQEVIAASMRLAALIPLVTDELRDRIEDVIDSQEAILHNLRMTVFGLKESSRRRIDALRAFTQTIHDGSASLSKRPSVAIDGPVSGIDDPIFLGSAVLALREMLSNVCRHARATDVHIDIRVDGGHLEIVVLDDGVGFDPGAPRGNGLSNLEARARGAGGEFRVLRLEDHHTEARFRVPCPEVTA